MDPFLKNPKYQAGFLSPLSSTQKWCRRVKCRVAKLTKNPDGQTDGKSSLSQNSLFLIHFVTPFTITVLIFRAFFSPFSVSKENPIKVSDQSNSINPSKPSEKILITEKSDSTSNPSVVSKSEPNLENASSSLN